MNYLESIAYLESLSPTLEKPTVERIKHFLQSFGNPQNVPRTFHVGGTNGKGSTVAVLDSVLRAAGLRVGRFTGPHLLRWNERFHVDGKPITDDQFAYYATHLRSRSESFGEENPGLGKLTWFEFITAMAFFYFRDENVQASVLEVGLGGRFDATNVLAESLLCSIITNISLDHTHILGATESLIAAEKAGIILAGKPVVTAAAGDALQVIKDRATELGAPIIVVGDQSISISANGAVSDEVVEKLEHSLRAALADPRFADSHGTLLGEHQRMNAQLAFIALYTAETGIFNVPVVSRKDHGAPDLMSAWSTGLKNVYWPGRMQQIAARTILDGAHNPGGARALRAALNQHFPDKRIIFVLSCFDNKDAGGILEALVKPGDRVLLCEAVTRRATFSKAKLLEMAHALETDPQVFDNIGAAYRSAIQGSSSEDLVVATGSFATVRECMQEIGWESVEDGRGKSGKIDSAETVR